MKLTNVQKKGERGRGHVYLQHGAWFLQFYQTENHDGESVRVRKSVKLHDKDREHNSATCKAVKALRDKEIGKLSTGRKAYMKAYRQSPKGKFVCRTTNLLRRFPGSSLATRKNIVRCNNLVKAMNEVMKLLEAKTLEVK